MLNVVFRIKVMTRNTGAKMTVTRESAVVTETKIGKKALTAATKTESVKIATNTGRDHMTGERGRSVTAAREREGERGKMTRRSAIGTRTEKGNATGER